MSVDVLVLNYNGRSLLETCLPSVVAAAARARCRARVWVVDNSSSDDSLPWLAAHYPDVAIVRESNRGLASFNPVLARLTSRVAILLNSDIRLDPQAVQTLAEPFFATRAAREPLFLTAPQCFRFDGTTLEGFRTAVGWRYGLVQATGLFPGHADCAALPGETAAVGAALAVDRAAFVKLGGFDAIYLPGRIEDLDLCYRAFQAGYRLEYVPAAVAYHLGAGAFGPAFGEAGNQALARRNTLLFQSLNLRHPWHRLRAALGLAVRFAVEAIGDVRKPVEERYRTWRAWRAARQIEQSQPSTIDRRGHTLAREREFFARFSAPALIRAAQAQAQSGSPRSPSKIPLAQQGVA